MILPEKMADHDLQGMKDNYEHLTMREKIMMRHIKFMEINTHKAFDKEDSYFLLREQCRRETADYEGKSR